MLKNTLPGSPRNTIGFLLSMALGQAIAGPGGVAASVDPALPIAYHFQEYRFPEPADGKVCTGTGNATAAIGKVFFAQTHVMEPGWTFFFLVSKRPALIQAIVTGSGASPEVSVRGIVNGVPVGTICLAGPAILPANVNGNEPRFDDRFSATLPAGWMLPGLSLEVKAGTAIKKFTDAELHLGGAPEINLVMLPLDMLDWNKGKPDIRIPESFLPDFASAMPSSMVRLGQIGARMALPTLAVSSETDIVPVILQTSTDLKGIPEGNINAAALRFIEAFKHATGDYAYAYYYGNTENFFPGGWGGDKSFVGADFGGVFLHEMGHALSLPHWGEGAYQNLTPDQWEYRYPYGGTTDNGGGRGEKWNYYQNINEFISPLCGLKGNAELGKERSDAMQRTHWCEESRSTGKGPWDGFGDFSAYAMYRFMVGVEKDESGTVPYKGTAAPYHFPKQPGFPTLRLDANGKRILERSANQPAGKQDWERLDFLVPQKWDTPVYSVYGTYHPQYSSADILYEPMAYVGNLPRVIDPTDSATFAQLAAGNSGPFGGYFYWEKDITFKFTYADGTVRHALYPFRGVSRTWKAEASPWRDDLLYFVLNIPADKKLSRIELYRRPFLVRGSNATDPGNIANPQLGITAKNFMENAVLVMGRNVNVEPPMAGTLPRPSVSVPALRYRLTLQGVEFSGLKAGAVVEVYDIRGVLKERLPSNEGRAVWKLGLKERQGAGRAVFWARTKSRGATSQSSRILLP